MNILIINIVFKKKSFKIVIMIINKRFPKNQESLPNQLNNFMCKNYFVMSKLRAPLCKINPLIIDRIKKYLN